MRTRLTQKFGIEHPIISAPMGYAAGGKLAAAVTEAGGLGLIGGGYGDAEWLKREFAARGDALVRRTRSVRAADQGVRRNADLPGANARAGTRSGRRRRRCDRGARRRSGRPWAGARDVHAGSGDRRLSQWRSAGDRARRGRRRRRWTRARGSVDARRGRRAGRLALLGECRSARAT